MGDGGGRGWEVSACDSLRCERVLIIYIGTLGIGLCLKMLSTRLDTASGLMNGTEVTENGTSDCRGGFIANGRISDDAADSAGRKTRGAGDCLKMEVSGTRKMAPDLSGSMVRE